MFIIIIKCSYDLICFNDSWNEINLNIFNELQEKQTRYLKSRYKK